MALADSRLTHGSTPTSSMTTATGDTLVVAFTGGDGTTSTPTDTYSNSWGSPVINLQGGGAALRVYVCQNATGGAGHQFDIAGAGGDSVVTVARFTDAPAASLDSPVTASDASANPSTVTGASTLAQASAIVVSWMLPYASGTLVSSVTTGYTKHEEEQNNNIYYGQTLASKVVAVTTAPTATWDISGGSGDLFKGLIVIKQNAAGSDADMTPAAGVATTATMVGSRTAAAGMTAAAGVATTSTMAGARTAAASMTPAAGVATTSTMSGRRIAAASMTPAAGVATTSTMSGRRIAAASMTPAAGVATSATMVGSSSSTGSANMVPAAGQATTSALAGATTSAASMVPAAGQATTATMTTSAPAPAPAPAPGGSEFGPGGRRTRNFKPLLARMLEARYPRVKPRTERAQKRAKAVEEEGAGLVLDGDGTLAEFEALAAQWMAQRPVMPAPGLDPLAVYLAQVAFRLRQQQALQEAAAWRRQQDEDAILVLLLA